jgi:hypothetical protein
VKDLMTNGVSSCTDFGHIAHGIGHNLSYLGRTNFIMMTNMFYAKIHFFN